MNVFQNMTIKQRRNQTWESNVYKSVILDIQYLSNLIF